MSIESVIDAYYRAVDAAAYDDLFALFASDIEYHRPGHPPLVGMDAFRQFYLEERPIGESHHIVDALYVDGDTAVVRGRFDGTLADAPVSFGFADIHQFDESGLIERRWTYTDTGTV